MTSFIKVEPIYTGGNIYCFLGQIDGKQWFLASDLNYDVRILNTDPFTWPDQEEIWYADWQEAHLIEDYGPAECLAFFADMLNWIKANEPDGNYAMEDMDAILNEVEELKNQKEPWR